MQIKFLDTYAIKKFLLLLHKTKLQYLKHFILSSFTWKFDLYFIFMNSFLQKRGELYTLQANTMKNIYISFLAQ